MLRVRKAHPTWGSKKILWTLLRERPAESWPAWSTVDAILSRAGVVVPRGRRRRRQSTAPPVVEAAAPNDVWSMDYKGWFRVGDGTRCDPLTVNGMCTQASLVCQAMVAPKSPDVKRRLEQAFVVFGLPRFMLSDGGPPFGSTGLGRLSRLGVWLLRIGVVPILIEPGRPDQNGRHERFHETLKAETATPPCGSIPAQQKAFNRFQSIYNEERPHEALAMKTPAEVYELSPRQLPSAPADHCYPEDSRPVASVATVPSSGAAACHSLADRLWVIHAILCLARGRTRCNCPANHTRRHRLPSVARGRRSQRLG
ncbi:MAG: transposase [Polyangiaceae bacterium]|nr:transposase [Polyangiaceae bacterium]